MREMYFVLTFAKVLLDVWIMIQPIIPLDGSSKVIWFATFLPVVAEILRAESPKNGHSTGFSANVRILSSLQVFQ